MYHTAAARRRHAAPASAPTPQEPTQGRFDGPSSRAKVQAVLDRARSRTARRSSVNGSDGSTAAAAVALVVSRSTLLRCGCVLLVALALLGVLAVSARRTLGVSVAHARDAEIVHSQQRWEHIASSRLMVVAALLERYARDEVRLRRNRTSTHELVDFVAARLDAARQGDFGLFFFVAECD